MPGFGTPDQQQQPQSPQTPVLDGGAQDTQRQLLRGSTYGEAAAALKPKATDGAPATPEEAQKEKERQAAALQSYQAALGSFLGTKLYEVIHKEVTPEKLLGYGNDALDGLFKAAGDQAGSLATKGGLDKDESAAVTALAGVLGQIANEKAQAFLKTPEGQMVLVAIRDYVEGHPWQVIAAIVVAAAGAVAANVDIPTLKQKIKIADGLTGDVTAKLGKIRDISLQAIQVGLSYEVGKLALRGEVAHSEKDGTKGTLTAAYGDDKQKIRAMGTLDDKGNLGVGLGYSLVRDKLELDLDSQYAKDAGIGGTAKLHWQDGDKSADANATYQDGNLSLGLTTEMKDQLLTYYSRSNATFGENSQSSIGSGVRYANEGTKGDISLDQRLDTGLTTLAASGELTRGAFTTRGAFSQGFGDGGQTSLSAGVKYSKDDLTAELDLALKGGDWTAKTSVAKDWGRLEAGANSEIRLNDGRLLSLGAHIGFNDPDHFRSFLLDYKRTNAADVPTDVFNARVDAKLGEIWARVQNTTTLKGGSLDSSTTSAHAAYFLKPDLALIGGGQYTMGPNPRDRALIQAGVQIRDVPVLVGFNPETKGWTIGLTIPFGGPKKR